MYAIKTSVIFSPRAAVEALKALWRETGTFMFKRLISSSSWIFAIELTSSLLVPGLLAEDDQRSHGYAVGSQGIGHLTEFVPCPGYLAGFNAFPLCTGDAGGRGGLINGPVCCDSSVAEEAAEELAPYSAAELCAAVAAGR